MAECLAGPGYNVEKLSIPYVPQVTGEEPSGEPSGEPAAPGGSTSSALLSLVHRRENPAQMQTNVQRYR